MEKTSNIRVPVLVKKGEAVPDNAIPMSDNEVLEIQERRIQNFKPQRDMWAFNYSQHVLGTSAAISGILLNSIFRKNFRLGGLRLMFTYGPTVVIPVIFSAVVHELAIKQQILLGKESCPTCVTLKSGVLHTLMGLCYPYLLSVLSCVPVAREYYTLPLPTTYRGIGFLRLLHHVTPSRNILLSVGLLNMFIGMQMSKQELKAYVNHLSKPEPPADSEILIE